MVDIPEGLLVYLLVASVFLTVGLLILWYFIRQIKEMDARRDEKLKTLGVRLNVLTSHETSRRNTLERRMYVIEQDIRKLKHRD